MTANDTWYMEQKISNWQELLQWYKDHKEKSDDVWIYRGQRNAEWKLKTSLERVAVERWGYDYSKLPKIERGILRGFRRQAYRYLDFEIVEDDLMQWLAVIQHHGGPTRLLDWTYSFFVAAFFAFEAALSEQHCAVWAIDHEALLCEVQKLLPDPVKDMIYHDPNAKGFETVEALLECSLTHVYPLNPLYLNERLILQQGIFLAPGDISKPFMSNLSAVVEAGNVAVVKLEICPDIDFLKTATVELRHMNISKATLFPGLDGLASNFQNQICDEKFIAID